jgi:hypothetical protein
MSVVASGPRCRLDQLDPYHCSSWPVAVWRFLAPSANVGGPERLLFLRLQKFPRFARYRIIFSNGDGKETGIRCQLGEILLQSVKKIGPNKRYFCRTFRYISRFVTGGQSRKVAYTDFGDSRSWRGLFGAR